MVRAESAAEREAEAIEQRLRGLADPERARKEARYLKSDLEHIGVSVPELRREARAAARRISTWEELLALVRALWAKPVHERRACAAYLLQARIDLLYPSDLPMLKRLIRECRTWALVDAIATGVVGPLLLEHPESADRLDAWARDPNFWVRRSALLAQLAPVKAGLSLERFSRYADPMLEEQEFFIRKAIGWVLREAAKERPDTVYEWLRPRLARCSSVTFREAVKYLPASQREELTAARALTRTGATAGR